MSPSPPPPPSLSTKSRVWQCPTPPPRPSTDTGLFINCHFDRPVIAQWYSNWQSKDGLFIRPSSDGTYYGMVMSVRPGLRPPVFHTFLQHALTYWDEILHMTLFYCTTDQVWVSSIPVKFCASYASFVTYITGNTQFSALFSNMLWHIELKLCIRLCFTVLQIKFECRQFASIFVGVMPLLELTILEIHSFPHFSLTCFDILSWNFAHDFVILYYRSSLSVDNLRQFLFELYPFWNLEYLKYTVFLTFLQHALTYWAENLHMTLLYCTSDQVRVSSISVKFCASYAPFVTYNNGNTQFSALFSYMLWHIQLKFCTWLCYTVLQIKFECCQFASIFVGVMPLLEHRILKIHSFPHFSLTCMIYWAEILHMTLFYWNADQFQVSSICVNFCRSYAPFGT